MPMLPSGRHVAILPDRLVKLLEAPDDAAQQILAIQSTDDLYPWLDLAFLVPVDQTNAAPHLKGGKGSIALPDGITAVLSGYSLAEWEKAAADWPEEDRTAMRAFLAEPRMRQGYMGQYLTAAKPIQERLRSGTNMFEVLNALYRAAGCHPEEDEGWEDLPDSPEWDTYDLLAALLEIARRVQEEDPLREDSPQTWSRLDAFLGVAIGNIPALSDEIDITDLPRAVAGRLREQHCIPVEKENWYRAQTVVECVNLWNHVGEALRRRSPKAYGIIELAVLSSEGARHS